MRRREEAGGAGWTQEQVEQLTWKRHRDSRRRRALVAMGTAALCVLCGFGFVMMIAGVFLLWGA